MAAQGIFVNRIIRGLTLQSEAFGEFANDERARYQPWIIVGTVGLAHALGVLGRSVASGWMISPLWVSAAFVAEITFWLGMVTCVYMVTRVVWGTGRSYMFGARCLALAELPGMLIAFGGLFVGREALLLIPILCLRLVAYYRAVRGGWGWSRTRSVVLVGTGIVAGGISMFGVLLVLAEVASRNGLASG